MGPFDLVTMSASHGDQAAIYQKHYLLIRFQTGNKINNLARGGPTSMTSIFLFLFSFFRASRKIPNRMTRLESYRMFQSYRIFYARDVCRWFTRSKCFRLVDLQKSLCCAKKKGKRIDRLTNGISWYQRVAKYRYSDSMLYRERDGNALMLHTL